MAGRNRLTILLDAKNQASGQLRSAAGDVSSFAQNIEQAFSLDGVIGGLGELSPTLGTVATGALAVGAAVGGWQLAKGAIDLGRLGAASTDTRKGFNELAQDAGTSGTALLNALKAGSAGAINNQQLMLAANRAMMLGVADSADEMSALMAVAANRGKKLGMDTQSAFNDLVTGLGRASPEILDNLAIMIDSKQVYEEYAISIGKSASALTDAEKKQALDNSVVAEGLRLMAEQSSTTESAAASFERMDAAIQNSKSALGELFAPAVAVVAENIARAAETATSAIEGMGTGVSLNDALGNIQALEISIRSQNAQLAISRDLLAQMTPGSADYSAQLRQIGAGEMQVTTTTRALSAARDAYFAALRQAYPAQEQDAAALNRTSVEAEGAMRAQTALNATLAQQGPAANQATASMDLLGASYELLLQRSAALEGVSGTLASIASGTVATLGESGALALYDEMTTKVGEQIAAWQQVGQSQAAIRDILLPAYIQQLQHAADNAVAMAIANGRAATSLEAVHSSALGAAQGLGQASGMFGAVAQAANVAADQVAAAAARLDQFAASAAAGMASDLVSTGGAGAAIAYYNQMDARIRHQTDLWTQQGYTIEQIEGVLLPGYVSGLRKATSQAVSLASGTRAVGSAAAKINQEFSDLESKVSSTLSGALGDIGGIKLDDLLPRQDAVSEDARRLADVAVNGFASPWASYFQQEFPDLWAQITASGDIKTGAAQMLRDFQDGLRPELLDKDRAKEIVKRAILGEKNIKGLTDEIAKELASELGISIQEAQSAAASALGGGGILGGIGSGEASKPAITPTLDQSLLPELITIPATIEWQTPMPEPEIGDLQVSVPVTGTLTAITVQSKLDTPAVTASASITSIALGSGVTMPDLQVSGTIAALTLSADVQNPQITLSGVIGGITLAETATPPSIVLPAGAWVNAVELSSTATLPTIQLSAQVTALTVAAYTSATEQPIQLSGRVTPYIDVSGITPENINAARTFLTEVLPVIVTPQFDTSSDSVIANTLIAGSNLAVGIMDGFRAYDVPGAIAYELSAGNGMYSAGSTNGQLFASGFLDFFGGNVPASVVNTLFNLVWTKIQSEQSRKAAK